MEDEDPNERIKSINQLLKIVKGELIKILEDPNQTVSIDMTINDIMDLYKNKYAYRKKI